MLTTYYFNDPEEALRRAKAAGKRPGRYFGGITLPSGKPAFAVYEGGEIVERYAVKTIGGKTPLKATRLSEASHEERPHEP